MLTVIEDAALSDVGRQRQGNEDNFLMASPVYAVADGMGGAQAGEVASRIAIDAFGDPDGPSGGPRALLTTIARAANRHIHELAQDDAARAGMGTTLSAAIVEDGEVSIGHVGDSRVYRYRDGELERMTTDHSYVQELVSQGRLTPEEAETHPQSAIITRALGPEPDVEVDTSTTPGRDGDVYLICSDGLTGMVPEREVTAVLRDAATLGDAARELVRAANENGGRDNITVVLFRLGEARAADADTLSGREEEVDAGHVRAAVAAAEAETATLDPSTADEALAAPTAAPASATSERRAATPRRRRRAGRGAALSALTALLVVAGLLGAAWAVAREYYFIDTSPNGFLTINRGLDQAPLGVELYRTIRESRVPATSVAAPQRSAVFDRYFDRGEAFDLIGQRERAAAEVAARAHEAQRAREARRESRR